MSMGSNIESASSGMWKKPAMLLLIFAVALTLLQWLGLLPESLHRLPESLVPPLAPILDSIFNFIKDDLHLICLLYTSPSPRDKRQSRMPSSA